MDRVLVIGGTRFIGRNLLERLVQSKRYQLTLFNRGLSNPGLFPDLVRLKGDRNTEDVNLIGHAEYDYIIDLSCYYPDSLSRVLNQVKNSIKGYIFISSCSVYDHEADHSINRKEDSPILPCSQSECSDPSMSTYGKRKAECERILVSSGLPFYILRPALVYGKYDPTDRFYYWLYQVKKQDHVLLPGGGTNHISLTYVNDLVEMVIALMNYPGNSGIYNASTAPSISISEIVHAASRALNRNPELHHVPAEFLSSKKIHEWTDIPLWINSDQHTCCNCRITAKCGIQWMDFEKSLKQTSEYYETLGWPVPAYGLSDSLKQQLIIELDKNC